MVNHEVIRCILDIAEQAQNHYMDHCVYQHIIYPAAGYIDVTLNLARESSCSQILTLQNCQFLRPLQFKDAQQARELELIASQSKANDSDEYYHTISFQQIGKLNYRERHAQIEVLSKFNPGLIKPYDLDAALARCPHTLSPDDFYSQMALEGIQYGPCFQGLRKIQIGEKEAVATISLPKPISQDNAQHQLHPVLLDGCIQMLASLLKNINSDCNVKGVYLPFSIKRLTLYRQATPTIQAVVKLLEHNNLMILAEIQLFTSEGERLASIEGYEGRQVSEFAFNQALFKKNDVFRHMYSGQWVDKMLLEETKGQTQHLQLNQTTLVLISNKNSRQEIIQQLPLLQQAQFCEFNPDKPTDFISQLQDAINKKEQETLILNMSGIEWVKKASTEVIAEDVELVSYQALQALYRFMLDIGNWGPCTIINFCELNIEKELQYLPTFHVFNEEFPHIPTKTIQVALLKDMTEERLLFEINQIEPGEQVIWKKDKRTVYRLLEQAAPKISQRPINKNFTETTYHLESSKKGSLKNLCYTELLKQKQTIPEGHIRIAINSAGINFRDVLNAMGLYPGDAGALGLDCAGTVIAVGKNVNGVKVNDRVMALAQDTLGSMTISHAKCASVIPDNLNFCEAATIPVVFLTAYLCLVEKANIQKGQRVLIHAGAGGVGLAAIQIAQLYEAEVFATAGSPRKRNYLKALGVQHVFDSRSTDYAEKIAGLTNSSGVDIILNALNKEHINKSFNILSESGHFAEIGKRDIWTKEQAKEVKPKAGYSIVAIDTLMQESPASIQKLWQALRPLFESGQLQPLPKVSFPTNHAIEAFKYMQDAKHIGKIILHGFQQQQSSPFTQDDTILIVGLNKILNLKIAKWCISQNVKKCCAPQSVIDVINDDVLSAKGSSTKDPVNQKTELIAHQVELLTSEANNIFEQLNIGAYSSIIITDDSQDKLMLCESIANDKSLSQLRLLLNYIDNTKPSCLDRLVLITSLRGHLGLGKSFRAAQHYRFLHAYAQARNERGLHTQLIALPLQQTTSLSSWLKPYSNQHIITAIETAIALNVGTINYADVTHRNVNLNAVEGDVLPVTFRSLQKKQIDNKISGAEDESGYSLFTTLTQSEPSERAGILSAYIANKLGETLGVTDANELSRSQGFNDLGLSSLTIFEFIQNLQEDIEQDLELTTNIIYKHTSINKLAKYLLDKLFGTAAETSPNPIKEETGVVNEEEKNDLDVLNMLEDEIKKMVGD